MGEKLNSLAVNRHTFSNLLHIVDLGRTLAVVFLLPLNCNAFLERWRGFGGSILGDWFG
jgi:hypothetical protein